MELQLSVSGESSQCTRQRFKQNYLCQTPFTIVCLRRCASTASPTQDGGASQRMEPGEMSNLMEIGSRRIFTEDNDIFRQSVRRYFNEQVQPEIPR